LRIKVYDGILDFLWNKKPKKWLSKHSFLFIHLTKYRRVNHWGYADIKRTHRIFAKKKSTHRILVRPYEVILGVMEVNYLFF
jgi:hypothetical protein